MAWLLDRHHEAVRASVARFNGREIDTAGDGFLVLFDRPGPAIHAAEAIITAVRGLGLATGSG